MFDSINFRAVSFRRASKARRGLAFSLAALLFIAGSAMANPNVTFSVRDFLSRDFTNKSVVITPIGGPFVDGTNIVAGQTYTTNTGSGSFRITNMVSGTYRVNLYGNPPTVWVMTVPDDTNSYSAAALVVVNPPGFTAIQNALLSQRFVQHTNGNLVAPLTFFSSNVFAAGSIGLSFDGSGNMTISNAASGGGSSATSALFVATNYVSILTAPSSNAHAVRLTELNTASNALLRGELILHVDFNGTNGVGSNVLASVQPLIGTFRHATAPAGAAPTTMIPTITNRALTYQPVTTNGTVYICYSAAGTNQIRRVQIIFDHDEVYGNGFGVSPLVHIMGNGEFVAAGDLMTHGGVTPNNGNIGFDGHLVGYGSMTQPSVSTTAPNYVPNALLLTNELMRGMNVFEYWVHGTNLFGDLNGWRFRLPYTNAGVFTGQTNVIIQFFPQANNATTARNPRIYSVKAWNSAFPDDELGLRNVPTFGGTAYNLTTRDTTTNFGNIVNAGPTTNSGLSRLIVTNFDAANLSASAGGVLVTNLDLNGLTTNMPGAVIVGSGSNAITGITSLGWTNGAGTTLSISGASSLDSATVTNLLTVGGVRILNGSTNLGSGNFSGTLSANAVVVTNGVQADIFASNSTTNNYIDPDSAGRIVQFVGGAAGHYFAHQASGFVWGTGGQDRLQVVSVASGLSQINLVSQMAVRSNLLAGLAVIGTNGVVSGRTSAWTTAELTADGQWADWRSNGAAFFRSARNNGNVTNYLITTTP